MAAYSITPWVNGHTTLPTLLFRLSTLNSQPSTAPFRFRDSSYGYRKGRNCHQAGAAVNRATQYGCHWIIELDIRN
jgi:hypothetical protein